MSGKIYLIVTLVSLVCKTASAGEPSLFDKLALELNNVRYLEQNWESSDRDYFYYTDQGSRLLPYDLFLNLEQADNDELFRSAANFCL
ncbi:MAG: hypothetical protein GKR93_10370 [Gammaproteobacteria bacterium]|nr:hypothetical protein [Gammaproteobacteria bacterium]